MNKEEIELTKLYNSLYLHGVIKDNNGLNSTIIRNALNLIDRQDKVINRLAQWVANLNTMVDKQSVIEIIYKEIESE